MTQSSSGKGMPGGKSFRNLFVELLNVRKHPGEN